MPHCFASLSIRLKGLLDREKEELAEAEVIKDSPDSPEPPNKKPLITMDEMPTVEKAKGKPEKLQQISLLRIEVVVAICFFYSSEISVLGVNRKSGRHFNYTVSVEKFLINMST